VTPTCMRLGEVTSQGSVSTVTAYGGIVASLPGRVVLLSRPRVLTGHDRISAPYLHTSQPVNQSINQSKVLITERDSCAEHLAVESYTVVICQQSYLLFWYFITHSLFHSRLKTFSRKSFPPQPFLFLLRDSLHGFPIPDCLLLFLSIFVFYFSVFLFLHFLVVLCVR